MAPQCHTLSTGTSEDRKGVVLVATYCGLQDQIAHSESSEELAFKTADGQVLQSFSSICRYLASSSSRSKQLLGDTQTDRAMVSCFCYRVSQAGLQGRTGTAETALMLLLGARMAVFPKYRVEGSFRGCYAQGQWTQLLQQLLQQLANPANTCMFGP